MGVTLPANMNKATLFTWGCYGWRDHHPSLERWESSFLLTCFDGILPFCNFFRRLGKLGGRFSRHSPLVLRHHLLPFQDESFNP